MNEQKGGHLPTLTDEFEEDEIYQAQQNRVTTATNEAYHDYIIHEQKFNISLQMKPDDEEEVIKDNNQVLQRSQDSDNFINPRISYNPIEPMAKFGSGQRGSIS